jgi:dTDP-4-amino-4,6-dideoxygalactose transaminase
MTGLSSAAMADFRIASTLRAIAGNAMATRIPFNVPPITDRELEYLRDAVARRELAGNGHYTKACCAWLNARLGVVESFLTQSCTAALEMAAILCDIGPSDEVIMPSFTFVSTANAVVLRGGVPVFVDIRRDTLNIDQTVIEAAITSRTKAIFVVHYAGVPCEMDAINAIAQRRNLLVVEDAAQALLSTYRGRPAGSLGDLGCFSFHASKNIVSGEGGALVTTRKDLAERAHMIWEKGTNRRSFLQGQVDKYTWVDIGSSFLPSELTAAFLAAQLEHAEAIISDRLAAWNRYHAAFENLEARGIVMRPKIPAHVTHNGHLYYLLLRDAAARTSIIENLKAANITAPFHYVPLHSSPAGKKFARASGSLQITEDIAARLVRLPLWYQMGDNVKRVVDAVTKLLN